LPSRSVSAAEAGGAGDRRLGEDGARVQPRAFDAGVAPRLVFALQLQLTPGLRAARQHDHVLRRHVGADADAPQRRREIERRAAESLPHVARRPQPVQLRRLLERGVEVLPQEPRAGRGPARADAVRFEQDDFDAGGGERRGAGASCQPAANDRDARTDFTALS